MSKGRSTAKAFALVAAGVLGVYVCLAGWIGLHLVGSGGVVGVLLGAAILALAMLGGWALQAELRFGRATQRLSRMLASAGGLPAGDLPRLPSGRPERRAADERNAHAREAVQQDPASWQAWFLVACSYDDCGDRRRARSAMRRAISLERAGVASAGADSGVNPNHRSGHEKQTARH